MNIVENEYKKIRIISNQFILIIENSIKHFFKIIILSFPFQIANKLLEAI